LRLSFEGALNGERAVHRVDDAGELYQCAVADQLDDAAVVSRNRRVEQAFSVMLQGSERAGVVGAHHAGVADHIRGKNGREPTTCVLSEHS
jgi:hypothetical protein